MSDHETIYLQPECCADPDTGRLWCDHDAPEDCEDGAQWIEYVRADIARRRFEELHNRVIEMHRAHCSYDNCVLDGGPEHQEAFNYE